MTEVLFYHLEQAPLEKVLPTLLEKSLERGWRVTVELGKPERLNDIDDAIWTVSDESFLPHATTGGPHDAEQPILLTTETANLNNSDIRFFVEGAVPRDNETYQRLVYLFDGHDPDAVSVAREAWKTLRDGHETTYWQQDDQERWKKMA